MNEEGVEVVPVVLLALLLLLLVEEEGGPVLVEIFLLLILTGLIWLAGGWPLDDTALFWVEKDLVALLANEGGPLGSLCPDVTGAGEEVGIGTEGGIGMAFKTSGVGVATGAATWGVEVFDCR